METAEEAASRLREAVARKPRRMSGWNVFVKERMQGQVADSGTYAQRQTECANEWRNMSPQEKEGFYIEATRQEQLRADLAATPLAVAPSHSGKADPTPLELEVGKKSCKRLSAKRLLLNLADYEQEPIWGLPTCLSESTLPSLL